MTPLPPHNVPERLHRTVNPPALHGLPSQEVLRHALEHQRHETDHDAAVALEVEDEAGLGAGQAVEFKWNDGSEGGIMMSHVHICVNAHPH